MFFPNIFRTKHCHPTKREALPHLESSATIAFHDRKGTMTAAKSPIRKTGNTVKSNSY
jgi:hypothetical protein